MTRTPSARLKRGRDKSLRNRHPWIFSGAFSDTPRKVEAGEIIDVLADDGAWIARGAFNPTSSLAFRALSWDREVDVGEALVTARLHAAIGRRPDWQGRRLVHMEADGLPGLIVDQYGPVLSLQILTPWAERHRDLIVEVLREALAPAAIFERSDSKARAREGLDERSGLLWGALPEGRVVIVEGEGERSGKMLIDVEEGQKTGFFLDQRESRWKVAERCSGARVLNAFSYTGGFAIACAAAGAAEITNVDISAQALALGEEAAALNGIQDRVKSVKADVFEDLRRRAKEGERWDAIVLDPPKFAHGKATLERACRGYKDINLMAMRLLRPGGTLATFSCSGMVTPSLFRSVVAGAAADAGRDVVLVEQLTQPIDHPILMTFPESEYLKGLILRVD